MSDLERQVESLKRDIRNLQLEHDLLKKASELIKKDLGVNLQRLSNQEKTMLVDALRNEYRVTELLGRLGLARSSYFYHRSPMRIADKYAQVRRRQVRASASHHHRYLRGQPPLIRLSPDPGIVEQTARLSLGKSRTALDEARMPASGQAKAADVSLVCWGSESCAREHHCSRLPRRRS